MPESNKSHILFITDNFPPEVNAPASRTFEHCREWVKANHPVTVVTGFPNFPSGKIHAGYQNSLYAIEEIAGMRVIRVKTFISANEGTLLRTLDYMSFMVSGFIAGLFVKKVDIVIGTSPQFFTSIAAYLVAKVKNVPWVFELRDLWPESIRALNVISSSLGSKLLDLLEKLELFLYRKSDAIICVTESFRENLVSRSIEPTKVKVITNGVDLNFFKPQKEKDTGLSIELGLQGQFVAGYIGTIGLAHALETLVDAAVELRDNPAGADISLVIIGDGAKKQDLIKLKESQQLPNIQILDSIPKSAVPKHLNLFDVSIIHLAKKDLFKTVIPSKLFESMGTGVPVVYGVDGESRALVLKHDIGRIFEPENGKDLARCLITLKKNEPELKELRANSLKAAVLYSRTHMARQMLAVLDDIVKKNR